MSERERAAMQLEEGGASSSDASVLQALPGLVRIAATAWWRTTEWTVTTTVRVNERMFRAAISGQTPADLFRESGTDLKAYLRRLLEIVDEASPTSTTPAASPNGAGPDDEWEPTLRERGAELLRRSADVSYDDHEHPAYRRILGQLAPDEARILRLLAREGPQAAVDIRTGGPLSIANSQLNSPGLTMIAREAGCRRTDRTHAYLDNLNRLGLIWFSREILEDQAPYQVLEAQPEVIEAMKSAPRTKSVRRSIHLTSFGEDFCEAVLPMDTEEIDALAGPAPDAYRDG